MRGGLWSIRGFAAFFLIAYCAAIIACHRFASKGEFSPIWRWFTAGRLVIVVVFCAIPILATCAPQ